MPKALEVRDLCVAYRGGIEALWSVDLEIEQGTMVALLGANGAGKTTLLRAVSGLLELEHGMITSGTVKVFGESLQHLRPHQVVRQGLFHVREGRHVFGDMSVEDNLIAATYARQTKASTRAFAEIYAYFPRLGERRKQLAGYLSGGEQQMLALGRAFIAEPRLVLLDEPSLGLAPKVIREIFEIIARIQKEKRLSILVVEQNASIALRYASHAYVIQSGRVAMHGSADEIRRSDAMSALYLGANTDVGQVTAEAAAAYGGIQHEGT